MGTDQQDRMPSRATSSRAASHFGSVSRSSLMEMRLCSTAEGQQPKSAIGSPSQAAQ